MALDASTHTDKYASTVMDENYHTHSQYMYSIQTRKIGFLISDMHKYRVLPCSSSVVTFVDFITWQVFPFLYCLGNSCLTVIKNNAAATLLHGR